MMIRAWNEYDVDAILAIEQEAFPVPLKKSQLLRELQNPDAFYFVAEENGKILGYGGFWRVFDEAQVMNIAVLSEARHSGVGSLVISAMIDHAARLLLVTMSLEVRASNTPAIRFYEKFGFCAIGKRKNYYRDNGETAIIMEKRLGE